MDDDGSADVFPPFRTGPDTSEQPPLLPFLRKVKSALRDVWKEAAIYVFDIGYALSIVTITRSQCLLSQISRRGCTH